MSNLEQNLEEKLRRADASNLEKKMMDEARAEASKCAEILALLPPSSLLLPVFSKRGAAPARTPATEKARFHRRTDSGRCPLVQAFLRRAEENAGRAGGGAGAAPLWRVVLPGPGRPGRKAKAHTQAAGMPHRCQASGPSPPPASVPAAGVAAAADVPCRAVQALVVARLAQTDRAQKFAPHPPLKPRDGGGGKEDEGRAAEGAGVQEDREREDGGHAPEYHELLGMMARAKQWMLTDLGGAGERQAPDTSGPHASEKRKKHQQWNGRKPLEFVRHNKARQDAESEDKVLLREQKRDRNRGGGLPGIRAHRQPATVR